MTLGFRQIPQFFIFFYIFLSHKIFRLGQGAMQKSTHRSDCRLKSDTNCGLPFWLSWLRKAALKPAQYYPGSEVPKPNPGGPNLKSLRNKQQQNQEE